MAANTDGRSTGHVGGSNRRLMAAGNARGRRCKAADRKIHQRHRPAHYRWQRSRSCTGRCCRQASEDTRPASGRRPGGFPQPTGCLKPETGTGPSRCPRFARC